MSFAAWVKRTRQTKGLTKVETARRAGVSHPVWAEYENTDKTAQPKRETVEKIALALEVPFSEALEAAGYSSTPSIALAHVVQFSAGADDIDGGEIHRTFRRSETGTASAATREDLLVMQQEMYRMQQALARMQAALEKLTQ